MAMILVVEDEPDTQRLVRHWLVADGHEVAAVITGERALEVLTDRAFDVVLLDVRLPGLSGYEVLRRIRQNGMAARVLLLTVTDAEDIPSDIPAELLAKPFTRETLQDAVRRVLERSC